jgi:hypothetical protein
MEELKAELESILHLIDTWEDALDDEQVTTEEEIEMRVDNLSDLI